MTDRWVDRETYKQTDSTVVEHLTNNPKVKGLNPDATTAYYEIC